ncbi:MAG TPA: hypothetical protein VGM62_00775 [Chthoniobacterales bacterium]|jgi:3-hydroxymyristoyl/3-hydroxydecanoyl-(acyl carrier protein) dehydratase
MTFEVQRTIPADHPSLVGHFPGAPIVPAVVILDDVATALAEWQNDSRIAEISTVKFLAPLKPEQPFTILLSTREETDDQFDFSCRTEDRIIVQGRLLARRRAS